MKITNTNVYNIDNAIRGMRNPMNSWNNSDSYWSHSNNRDFSYYVIGPNDMKLIKSLIGNTENKQIAIGEKIKKLLDDAVLNNITFNNDVLPEDIHDTVLNTIIENIPKQYNGSEHAKFLRQIFVSCDIDAPLYFWSEMDTYKVGTTANSTSTMHRIVKDGVSKDDFEQIDAKTMDGLQVDKYAIPVNLDIVREQIFEDILIYFKELKDLSNRYPERINDIRRLMKEVLPTSFKQKRTWTANYAVVRNIYHQRKNHRLLEWSKVFVDWVYSLPYAEEFIIS